MGSGTHITVKKRNNKQSVKKGTSAAFFGFKPFCDISGSILLDTRKGEVEQRKFNY